MEGVLSIGFYLKNDYDKILNEVVDTEYKDVLIPEKVLLKIICASDPIIAFYLLDRLEKRLCKFSDDVLKKLGKFIESFKEVERYKTPRFDCRMAHIIFSGVSKDVNIEAFLECVSKLKMSSSDLDFIKRFFGYGQIYRYSKKVLSKILDKKYNENEIGYALALLNHPTLCYKNLLSLIKRINMYVDNILIDKNILGICTGLRAILKYSPEALDGNENFMLSVLVFLIKILYQPELYTYMGCYDLKGLLSTIETLVKVNAGTERVGNIAFSSFERALTRIKEVKSQKAFVVEDMLLIYGLLGLCKIFYKIVKSKEACYKLTTNIKECIESLQIERPSYIHEDTWYDLQDTFLKEKYSFLEAISKEDSGFSLEMNIFKEDISRCENVASLLDGLDSLCRHVEWSVLIDMACDPKYRSSFAMFVFSKVFLAKKNHMTYALTYFDSVLKSEDTNVVLFSTIQICNNMDSNNTRNETVIPLFSKVFLEKGFLVRDQRIVKIAEMVIVTAMREGLLFELLEAVLKSEPENKSCGFLTLTLIIVCFYKRDEPHGDVRRLFNAIHRGSRFIPWESGTQKDRVLLVNLVASGIVLSRYNGHKLSFLKGLEYVPEFYSYVIFLISSLRQEHLDRTEFTEFEEELLEFLFKATSNERMELERLYFFLKKDSRTPHPGNSPFIEIYKELLANLERVPF